MLLNSVFRLQHMNNNSMLENAWKTVITVGCVSMAALVTISRCVQFINCLGFSHHLLWLWTVPLPQTVNRFSCTVWANSCTEASRTCRPHCGPFWSYSIKIVTNLIPWILPPAYQPFPPPGFLQVSCRNFASKTLMHCSQQGFVILRMLKVIGSWWCEA